MFGQPEAVIARGLGVLRQVERVGQGIGGGEAFADISEVEDGELNHDATLAHARVHASGQ